MLEKFLDKLLGRDNYKIEPLREARRRAYQCGKAVEYIEGHIGKLKGLAKESIAAGEVETAIPYCIKIMTLDDRRKRVLEEKSTYEGVEKYIIETYKPPKNIIRSLDVSEGHERLNDGWKIIRKFIERECYRLYKEEQKKPYDELWDKITYESGGIMGECDYLIDIVIKQSQTASAPSA